VFIGIYAQPPEAPVLRNLKEQILLVKVCPRFGFWVVHQMIAGRSPQPAVRLPAAASCQRLAREASGAESYSASTRAFAAKTRSSKTLASNRLSAPASLMIASFLRATIL
jgi:hypothetical protein